jgi:hypothetical protein
MKTFRINRMALTAASILCLGASAIAGPAPMMFMMMHGKMMEVIPMTKDMSMKNGMKVSMDGTVMTPAGKKMMMKEGEMVSAEGMRMSPPSTHAHGS